MKPELSFFKEVFVLILFATAQMVAAKPYLKVTNLRCEYKSDPIGIDVLEPRLSWQIESGKRGIVQAAYEIRVASDLKKLSSKKNLLWSTGKVNSDQSIHVVYKGPALKSGQRVFWQVRVWDQNGKRSAWSVPAYWEMGLLNPSDWQADWIHPNIEEDVSKPNPAQMLRKEFTVRGPIKRARAYVTALGLYEMELNGKKVGDQLFTPGWTSYHDHIQYQTYDVTRQLRPGKNAVGVTLGDGWYRGYLLWSKVRNVYGDKLALLMQIVVEYANGDREIIVTDDSWKASTGPILMSDIYDGETYDARLEKAGWSKPGFDDADWVGVQIIDQRKDNLVAPAGPPVTRMEEVKPIKILVTPAGDTVVDMGQNMVGWIRLKVKGPAGTTVTLRHAEVLDKEGNFYTANLRKAKQTDKYTLKGKGIEIFEPHFTFHGFRYVAVKGFPGELTLDALTGVVVYSAIQPTGMFECSNPMINQLQHNIQWGQKGNFLDVPTDCPQRDERLGWTGDAQVFARTACFNADVAAFYTKWLKDFIADQQAEGQIPHVIPDVLSINKGHKGNSASAGWADAAVIVPWTVYLCYGDKRILEQQYDCMKGWVDYQAKRAGDTYFWNTDFTFGDWLAFNTTRSDYPGATTDKDFISQVFFARSTDLLQRTAAILGKEEDAKKYAELLKNIKRVFRNEFLTPNGRLSPNTQTAYCLALQFDLVPDDLKPTLARRLVGDVKKFKHITTGFLGASHICPALSNNGYIDEAFMLLNRKEYPSWLYPITRGATTIWERWDGIKPDGTFQNPGMNSFNHYAYGAIGEWLYQVVAGIEIDEQQPGYKHIIIQPHPGGGLTYARASVLSMYGKVASGWELQDGSMKLAVEIPANTTATIILPSAKLAAVTESGKPLQKVKGITKSAQQDDTVVLEAGSGKYEFQWKAQ